MLLIKGFSKTAAKSLFLRVRDGNTWAETDKPKSDDGKKFKRVFFLDDSFTMIVLNFSSIATEGVEKQ